MSDWLNKCHFGDCLQVLQRMPDGIVNTCVTSPPYFGLRDYGHTGQIGLEPTPGEFIAKLVTVFREVRRVLHNNGTLWVNMGDSYAGNHGSGSVSPGAKQSSNSGSLTDAARSPRKIGLKSKDLIGVPWMLAFALRADGWYLRQDIIWAKPNPMPESVTDRCTKSHEYIFLLSKSPIYYCDMEAVKEAIAESTASDSRLAQEGYDVARPERGFPGQASRGSGLLVPKGEPTKRNKRSVWTVSTKPYKGAHFATFPADLIEPCILAGAPAGGVVLDPFFGSGTTGQVAQALGRKFIGIELNTDYKALQDERLQQPSLELDAA